MKRMTTEELMSILDLHKKWLNNEDGGERADLRYANLQDVLLRGKSLQGANLYGADLRSAYLRGTNLQGADLRYANLQDIDLQRTNLASADLHWSNLQDSYLQGANLQGANFSGAVLTEANFSGADTTGVHGIDIYSMDNVGTYNGKVTYSPSLNTVWAGCWAGTPEAFYERCDKVMKERGEHLNLNIAKSFIKQVKEQAKCTH